MPGVEDEVASRPAVSDDASSPVVVPVLKSPDAAASDDASLSKPAWLTSPGSDEPDVPRGCRAYCPTCE